jgi:outer membrane lipoprotein SlyB
MTHHLRSVALVPALLLAGCATTTTYSQPYDAGPPPAALEGRVESIHEVVRRTQGDPGGGAIAGAVVGGLLGGALTGHGAGAMVGAIGGAATGAAVSQGSSEERWYEVRVRFDDGSWGRIDYGAPPPFRVGDRVRQSSHGLVPASRRPLRSPPREPPPPREPAPPDDGPPQGTPPPPPAELPPPPVD